MLNLFGGSDGVPRRANGSSANESNPRRSTLRAHGRSVEHDANHELFVNCVAQVQRGLKASLGSPSALHTLASYYTKVEPYIEGRPFCVSLSYATFLFHMQMARISVADVELYVQLIVSALGQISEEVQLRHPFVQQVLRDHVFGLPSATCRGGAHCVVLVPPPQYRGYATLTTALLSLDVVPLEIVYQFQDRLEYYCGATSPMVANRALALLVQCVTQVRLEEQVRALQYVLKTKPTKMNVDFLLACYERLKRAVRDPANGPSFGRALSIHCSELFLRFHSPVRRAYVESFLYPSLCHPDMAAFLRLPATRQHLMRELLSQCTPAMAVVNPFYLCLCALLQPCLDDEMGGAVEFVAMMNCRMPHAAYLVSTLAVDAHMSVSMFAKVIIALVRGAGLAMTGRDARDAVAAAMGNNRTSVYNVLFTLREVVRSCSTTASRRATDMLTALRVALAPTTIEALGKLASEAFADEPQPHGASTLDPQLLCAELAMVLHQAHIEAAVQSALSYLGDATTQCPYCGLQRSAALLCPVNGVLHVTGQSSISRVLATLAECAGGKALEERLIYYLRDPTTQMDGAVHFLVYHILVNAGQHRQRLFVALEPYIRGTLLALVSADRGTARGLVSSERKASVLMLHVKLAMLLTTAIDPTYLASLIKVFCELKLRTNHDALALWYMGNLLLRNCKGIIDLLPTDPEENRYCVDHPGCAPESAACADNAQLVLRLLDRAHSFSVEMHKLVGCCVCKLIQDFNMQAPNIIGTLLSSYGFVPVGLPSLSEFALPVGAGSAFWGFVLHQMRTSAPARTAFMAALAKSIARRFRIATPADAVAPSGVETTGHLFAVMVYEAMKRNPPLARVLLFMVTHWMRQAGHTPGKFVCLVYVCIQLVTTVLHRGDAPAAVELEAETPQDRHQFEDCVQKAGRALGSQQGRLDKLLPLARRDNAAFFQLVRRLRRKLRHTAAVAQGEPETVASSAEDEDDGNDAEAMSEHVVVAAADGDGRPYSRGGEERAAGDVTLAELQNAADDSVFDDYDAIEGAEAPAYVAQETGLPLPQPRLAMTTTTATTVPLSSRQAETTATSPASAKRRVVSYNRDQSSLPAPPPPRPDDVQATTVGATPHNAAVVTIATQAEAGEHEEEHEVRLPSLTQSRSVSRGVQTERVAADTGGTMTGVADGRAGRVGMVDRGVTAPAERSVGTSPIASENEESSPEAALRGVPARRSHTIASAPNAPAANLTRTPGNRQPPHEQASSSIDVLRPDDDSGVAAAAATPASAVRDSAWHEPDLASLLQGDTSPIDDTALPHLQAATDGAASGTVLPSGMVLEYLRTHQAMDSLTQEMVQLRQSWLLQQQVSGYEQAMGRAEYAPLPPPSQQMVAMEGRENNYAQPHMDQAEAGGRAGLVQAPVRLQTTYPLRQGVPPAGAIASRDWRTAPDETAVVDGEHDLTPVSGPPETTRATHELSALKRQRAEGQSAPQLPVLPPAIRGVQFFLQRGAAAAGAAAAQNVMSALQEVRPPRAVERLAPQPSATTTTMIAARSTVVDALATENLPPATPYGQVVIPACFVEQKNDTAIRELQQVMGAYNPNDNRLSSGASALAGRGRKARRSGTGRDAEGSTASGPWWSEMSSAPMPDYAVDPQYSMELF